MCLNPAPANDRSAEPAQPPLAVRKPVAICSYCQQQRFQLVLWHGQAVFPQDSNVTFNRLLNVPDRFLTRGALGDATGQTRALRYPVAVLAGMNQNLSHG